MTVRILDYDHSHAAGVAQMWNESDEAWPWSFTGGIPMTSEFVQDWIGNTDYITLQVALEADRLLGFCLVTVYPNERDCCYVQLLNVSPDSHGKGVGRDLLKRAVEAAAAGKYRRIDLNTWASNKKAVPLYKKCGFFWLEDTSVYMQNYVPQIMNTAAGKEFFSRHNWYDSQVRELAVTEDCQLFEGNAAYCYRWQVGEDILEATIDRNSQQITALGTSEFYASAWADKIQLTNSSLNMSWRLENRSLKPLDYVLVANGQKGVEGSIQKGGQITDKIELSSVFKVGEEEGPEEKPRLVPATVISSLVINAQALSLATGIRPVHAVQITSGPEYPAVAAGSEATVIINLREAVGTDVSGSVSFAGTALDVTPQESEFTLAANGVFGLPVTIRGSGAGVGRLVISLRLAQGPELSETIPVAITAVGPVSYRRKGKLISQNSRLRAELDLKGGRTELYDLITGKQALTVSAPAVGPNFWPSEFLGSEGEPMLSAENIGVRFRSTHVPDLEVERCISLQADSVVVKNRLLNRSSRPLKVSMAQYIGLDWLGIEEHLYMPLGDSIIHHRIGAGVFPAFENDFPDQPSAQPQHWLAVTMPGTGQVGGIAWTGAEKNKLHYSESAPQYELTLEPGSSTDLPEMIGVWASGDWRIVQRHWQDLSRQPAVDLPVRDVVEPRISPVAASGDTVTVTMYNRRKRMLTGSLHLRSQTGSFEPSLVNIKDVNLDSPGEYPLTVRGRSGLAAVTAVLETPQLTYRRTLPLLITGSDPVQVSEGEVWKLQNGALELTVAPDYFGAVTNLLAAGSPQLESNWPEPATLGPFNPWYGGIHPVFYPLGHRFPGMLYKEKPFRVQKATCGRWQGIELSWNQFGTEKLNGLEFRVSYLVLPGVNVLAVVREILNPAALALTCHWGLAITPAPGDRPPALGFASADGTYQRLKLGAEFMSINCEGYIDVFGAGQQRVLTRDRVSAVNNADGLVLQVMSPTAVELRGKGIRRVDYLVFGDAESVTEIKTDLDGA